ncbi:MAG: hypothetical protein ACLR2G_04010 [Phascolarctobacterium faecium]
MTAGNPMYAVISFCFGVLWCQGRIAGAYEVSPEGFIYAKIWFKYLMSAQIMFILLQLFHGNM